MSYLIRVATSPSFVLLIYVMRFQKVACFDFQIRNDCFGPMEFLAARKACFSFELLECLCLLVGEFQNPN